MYLRREKQIIFSIEEVKKIGSKIFHNDHIYTLRQWYAETSTFRKVNKEVCLINTNIHLPNAYLAEMYKLNVKKHSFTTLILPCIVFLLISLISSSIHVWSQGNPIIDLLEINETSILFFAFLELMLFLFATGLFYKYFIKQTKIVYTKKGRAEGYKHMTNESYLGTINNLECDKFIYFKPIETKRLTIRELDEKDVEDYFYFASSEIVHKHLSSLPIKSIDESLRIIKNVRIQYGDKLIYKLGIISREHNKLIGYIGLSTYDLTLTTCQVVYAIHEDYWGLGFVGEALDAFVTYLKSVGKTLIIAGHVDENVNSGKVLLKNGFKRVPSRDHQMIIHGELKKILSYAIGERKEEK